MAISGNGKTRIGASISGVGIQLNITPKAPGSAFSGTTIDGEESQVITDNYGSLKIYMNDPSYYTY